VKLTTHLHATKLKNELSTTSAPPICLRGLEKENLTLHYIYLTLGIVQIDWREVSTVSRTTVAGNLGL